MIQVLLCDHGTSHQPLWTSVSSMENINKKEREKKCWCYIGYNVVSSVRQQGLQDWNKVTSETKNTEGTGWISVIFHWGEREHSGIQTGNSAKLLQLVPTHFQGYKRQSRCSYDVQLLSASVGRDRPSHNMSPHWLPELIWHNQHRCPCPLPPPLQSCRFSQSWLTH